MGVAIRAGEGETGFSWQEAGSGNRCKCVCKAVEFTLIRRGGLESSGEF